jgi:hypothetical protein
MTPDLRVIKGGAPMTKQPKPRKSGELAALIETLSHDQKQLVLRMIVALSERN